MKTRNRFAMQSWLLVAAAVSVIGPAIVLVADVDPAGPVQYPGADSRLRGAVGRESERHYKKPSSTRIQLTAGEVEQAAPMRFRPPSFLKRLAPAKKTPAPAPANATPSVAAPSSQPAANDIQLTAENQGETDIQQKLRELYERDGRQMPSMNISDLPSYHPGMPSNAGAGAGQQAGQQASQPQPLRLQQLPQAASPSPTYTPSVPRANSRPPQSPPSKTSRTKAFLRKLNPFSRKSEPEQPKSNRPPVPSTPALVPAPQTLVPPPRDYARPITQPAPRTATPQLPPPPAGADTPVVTESVESTEPETAAEPQNDIPMLQIPADDQLVAPPTTAEPAAPTKSADDLLENAFPELDENEADNEFFEPTKPGKRGTPPPAEIPTTELPVITPRGEFIQPEIKTDTAAPEAEKTEENPFATGAGNPFEENPFEPVEKPQTADNEPQSEENPFDAEESPFTPAEAADSDGPVEADSPFAPVEETPAESDPEVEIKQALPEVETVVVPESDEAPESTTPDVDRRAFDEPAAENSEDELPTLPNFEDESRFVPLDPPQAESNQPESPAIEAESANDSQLDLPPLPGETQQPGIEARPEPPREPRKLSRQEKLEMIEARASQKGLQGFCPVVLRDSRDLIDARPEFSSTFDSKTYHFSSAEAKEKFDQDPERYAPAAAGHDVVRLAEATEDVEGSLVHAAWFRDRLYLFSTSESKHKFVAAPTDFVVE